MKIGFDIDGVLARFEEPYAALLTERTGLTFPLDDPGFPSTWNWERDLMIPIIGERAATAAENSAWERIKNSDFWRQLPAFADARAALERLTVRRYAGDDIYFITTRPGKNAKFYTEEWLKAWGFSTPTVLIADSSGAKGDLALGLQLDVFIDDKPSNCEAVYASTTECWVVLLNKPYNTKGELSAGIDRVDSVGELLDQLDHGDVLDVAA